MLPICGGLAYFHLQILTVSAIDAVFDGEEPRIKRESSSRRRNLKFNMLCKIGRDLSRMFGCPVVEASGEAEASCVALTRRGDADVVASSDSDALAYGAQVLLKHVETEDFDIVYDRYSVSQIHSKVSWLGGPSDTHVQAKCILVGLICGCDYFQGVPTCGSKAAQGFCEGLEDWGIDAVQLVEMLRAGADLSKLRFAIKSSGEYDYHCSPVL